MIIAGPVLYNYSWMIENIFAMYSKEVECLEDRIAVCMCVFQIALTTHTYILSRGYVPLGT